MSYSNKPAIPERRRLLPSALLILPAVALGVMTMIQHGISPLLWGQQLAAWAALALLAQMLRRVRISSGFGGLLMLLVLAASLLGEEVDGARRWLELGIFNVNAAMLVLPVLLVTLCAMKCPHPALLAAAAILCVQPDLSQLTALSAAAMPIVWHHRKEKLWLCGSILMLLVFMVCCMLSPVSVAPVEYCEGILTMLNESSPLLMCAGVIALVAIPACFAYGFFRRRQTPLLVLAVYYTVTLGFILTGEYPVPFMGFGLSPIAGYYLAYNCHAMTDQNEIAG